MMRLFPILLICIALQLSLSTAAILGNETDKLALIAFKNGITQDPLQVLSSWNDSLHFCQWNGVTCGSRRQRVIMLNLDSQKLIGSVSPFIGNLSFLRNINLRNNSLTGEIPAEVGRLFRLQYLRMNNNSFSGQIPVSLSQCSNLVLLSLGYNKLEGNIPVELGSLSKLANVSVSTNNLRGEVPASFGNLSNLENLYLNANNFEGSIPSSFGQLRKLIRLSVSENMLTGIVPPSIYNLSSLQAIYFTKNQLEGNLPSDIGSNLPNLSSFLVARNNFSGTIPVSLFMNASNLQTLDLGFNNFTGKVPTEVGSLKELVVLQLAINNLGSEKSDDLVFVTSLTNCSNLQYLDFAVNRFRDTLPISIANFSDRLNYLYFGDNAISGNIPSEVGNLVNLMLLSAENNLLTGSIPSGIGTLQNLQILVLSGNSFSGEVPYSTGNISGLINLDLSNNMLEGNTLPSLENCQFLQTLNLSHNRFNGTIPKEVVGLSRQLRLVSLAHNFFTGPLPSEVGNLKNLQFLDVSENKMLGQIPSTLGSCSSLEYLYLQDNLFQGPIPSSFSSLKGMQDLDLSRNNFSGEISKDLGNLSSLKNLNISFNNFEGEVPTEGIFQNANAVTVVGNDKLCGGDPELHLLKCQIRESKKRGAHLTLKVTLGILIPLLILTLIIALYMRQPKKAPTSNACPDNGFVRVSYSELHKATDGFSTENLIGMGSYGTVYKGVIHQNASPIAVKVLNLMEQGAFKSFIAECEVLREVRHKNLLKIITVCSSVDFEGNDFKALVFEFMPNGSVEDWLHPSSDGRLPRKLDLLQRLNIAIDVASALDYLHNDCHTSIVHCDLKPSNILLDDDMVAYVGDFGLAKLIPKAINNPARSETNSVAIRGTIGYIPPEYGVGVEVSKQGDIYSYGILLLEMFTGRRPTDEMFKDGLSLHSFSKMSSTEQAMNIVDVQLLSQGTPNVASNNVEEQRRMENRKKNCLSSIMRIGVACSLEPIGERMDIKDVLMEMHALKRNFV